MKRNSTLQLFSMIGLRTILTMLLLGMAVNAEGNINQLATSEQKSSRFGNGEGYDPASPGDPDGQVQHSVTVHTIPPDMAYFSYSNSTTSGFGYGGGNSVREGESFKMNENTSCYLHVNPYSIEWKLTEWTINGVKQEGAISPILLTMGEQSLDVVAYFAYRPASPTNPGANYFNPTTGKLIIDDFKPDYLRDVAEVLVGWNYLDFDKVTSILVKGELSKNDFSYLFKYTNAQTMDISRTSGLTNLGYGSFSGWEGTELFLPSTIDNLGEYVFRNCANLQHITIYSLEPPTCHSRTFREFPRKNECKVYVPVLAYDLYLEADGWKDLDISPIIDNSYTLQVNLPADATDGRYKNNSLEIVNIHTGVRQKYLVSDRLIYAFSGLQQDETYLVYMTSKTGIELGRIENVVIPAQDTVVTLDNLKPLYEVDAKVVLPDNSDVTQQVTVEWFKSLADGTTTYLRKGTSLDDLLEGEELLCRVSLNENFVLSYSAPQDTKFVVGSDGNTCRIQLVPFRSIELKGTVTDNSEVAINGASVSVVQTLNGQFKKTSSVKTDKKGQWQLSVLDAPETLITYAAPECVNANDTLGVFEAGVERLDVGRVALKPIVGARITYDFTYQAVGSDKVDSIYSDYNNVAISVYNESQQRAHNEVSLQHPLLVVLDESIRVGDQLSLTAVSKTGAFHPITRTVTVDDNRRANATFDIVGKGGITASFIMTDNSSVIALLYSSKGELLKKGTYSEAKMSFTELEDGDYTLVSMGRSDLMSSILRLSSFSEMGLSEGKDYVANSVTVKSGCLTEIKNLEVPLFDESLFYYTNSNTGFSSNKTSITVGDYLTLRSAIDFKELYKNEISNVTLMVDLPENCDFVNGSACQVRSMLPYSYENNRLTIPLGDYYQGSVRFCVIPTQAGTFNASAAITFDYNGKTIVQPIGAALAEQKDLECNVPTIVAGSSFMVTGQSLPRSKVSIYEDGSLLGTGTANAKGFWSVECSLNQPYNNSTHSIVALIETPDGYVLTSATKTLTYDHDALLPLKVTMYHYNPEQHQTYESVFDYFNPKTTPTVWTVYDPKKQFTYTIEFTDNDTSRISNVVLNVHAANGQVVPVAARFDSVKHFWVAEIDMGNQNDGFYPVNCSVDYVTSTETLLDADYYASILNDYENLSAETTDELAELNSLIEQYDALAANENVDNAQLQAVINSVHALLGIAPITDWDTSADYTDEEIEQLLAEGEALLSKPTSSFVDNLFTQTYAEINDMLEGIVISDCSNINEQELLSKGFTAINRTDGSALYFLSTDNGYEVVDMVNNKHIVFDWSNNDRMQQYLRAGSNVSLLEQYCNELQAALDKLRGYCMQIASLVEIVDKELLSSHKALVDEVLKVSEKLQALRATPNASKMHIFFLEMKRKALWESVFGLKKASRWLNTHCSPKKLRVGTIGGGAFAAVDLLFLYYGGFNDLKNTISVYRSIPDPCENDQARASQLQNACVALGVAAGVFYEAQIAADVVSILSIMAGISATAPSGGTSLAAVAVAIGVIVANVVATEVYARNFNKELDYIRTEVSQLECETPPPPPPGGFGGGFGGGASSWPDDEPVIDPSGYVYEAVPSNRVEGVQATIYYKETKEDMFGDLYEEVMLWNAEEYAQSNPLFTDENGMYRWDVPQGLWQVKFEKDGYQTAFSEWLPVPPPQLDVNIAITQTKQPEIVEARAYETGIELQFDKFMDLSTLTTSTIYVTANGEKLNGAIRFIDESLADEFASEDDAEALRYASRVRFVPEQTLASTTGEIRLTVSRNVRSYAGINMAETYSQVLDVEKEVQIIHASDVKVLYGGEQEVTIYAMPSEAAVGRTLRIVTSSSLIAPIDLTEATLDDEGKAVIKVKGDLPGRAQLSFSIDDVSVTGSAMIDVVTEIVKAVAPKSSRASGTAVYRGAKIVLSTESKNATIYFTTDGSCPCDESGTRRKYTVPIVIDDNTRILAMTTVGEEAGESSEVVEFNYTLKRSEMDVQLNEGWTWISHNLETPVAVSALATDENITHIVGQTQETLRDPQMGWTGTLTELAATNSYKVKASTATVRQRLSDIAWNPATHISVTTGWNWLGYPVEQTMTVAEAFATTQVDALDVVVGQNGFAQYDGEKWLGTLETLSPGKGYLYQSQSDKKIAYNTSIVSKAAAQNAPGLSSQTALVVDVHKYPMIMPIVATVCDENGLKLDNSRYQVVAFCGSECRGIGRVVEGRVMMAVYGNSGDHISLQITTADGETSYGDCASLDLRETIVGDLFTPYEIRIKGYSGVSRTKYDGNISVSIEEGRLRIKGISSESIDWVEIYDLNGKKILRATNLSESGINVSSFEKGLYVVIVNENGDYTYHKVVMP